MSITVCIHKNSQNLNQSQHRVRIQVPRNRYGSVKWRAVSIFLWDGGATPERRVWFCNMWMIAAEKKWSVQQEDKSMGNDITGSIKSSSTSHTVNCLQCYRKPPRLISQVLHWLLKSGRHAEFLLARSSNVINRAMEKIRINPKNIKLHHIYIEFWMNTLLLNWHTVIIAATLLGFQSVKEALAGVWRKRQTKHCLHYQLAEYGVYATMASPLSKIMLPVNTLLASMSNHVWTSFLLNFLNSTDDDSFYYHKGKLFTAVCTEQQH